MTDLIVPNSTANTDCAPIPPPAKTAPPELTVADVIAKIRTDAAYSSVRIADLRSGVARILKALQMSPEHAPAIPRLYTEKLARLTPAALGISNRRLSNCRSAFNTVLHYAGRMTVPRRAKDSMEPAFKALYEAVTDRKTRINLCRFFRYMSRRGMTPADVSTSSFERFLHDLRESGDSGAERADRNARIAWNAAAKSVPGWPNELVEVPSYVDHYVLPIDAFHPGFRADIEAYVASRSKNPSKDPLDDLGIDELFAADATENGRRAGPVRDSTARLIAYQLRQFASVLVREQAIEIEQIQGICDIVGPRLVKHGLRIFISRAGGHRNSQIFGIATKLAMAARFWVKLPESQLKTLDLIAAKVRPLHTGLPESARRSLAPMKSADNVKAFLNLPDRIFDELAKKKVPTRIDANLAATALWIALVQRIPLRISNLCTVDLERNVLRAKPTKGAPRSFYFTADEVKNDKPIEAPLSPRLVWMMDTYIERYRPRLHDKPSTALFPDRKGQFKRPNSMSSSVQQLLKRRLGFTVNPHSFRHVAAMLYLSVHPGDYARVQLLLGHRRLETTIKYYCDLRTEDAFAQFDKVILKLSQEEAHG